MCVIGRYVLPALLESYWLSLAKVGDDNQIAQTEAQRGKIMQKDFWIENKITENQWKITEYICTPF
jgi:hypothetical protein